MSSSRASDSNYVSTRFFLSHAMNFASVDECEAMCGRAKAQATGFLDERAMSSVTDRWVSGSAAQSLSVWH